MPTPLTTIALIGFGEAGAILGQDLAAQGLHVTAYDRLLDDPAQRPTLLTKAETHGVHPANSPAQAAKKTQLIISAVTAGSALEVAQVLAAHLRPGQFYLDLNSVAPTTKQTAATAVEATGAHYIDCAVMAPVPPKRLATPMLLGGAKAASLAAALTPLGFSVRTVAETVGVASAIKMCRSVMIKGLEALTSECLLAARRYGAEEAVLESLACSFPGMGWDAAQPHYLIGRVAEHGRRRAEEMREVAHTLADVQVSPCMSQAIAATQQALVDAMAAAGLAYAEPFDWRELADALAARR